MLNFGPKFVFGNRFDNDLTGTDLSEWIFGFNGADTIIAKGGDDFVVSGNGADFIDLGAGNDVVFAGSGDDTIITGDGNDSVDGGTGFDTVRYAGSIADYTFSDGPGARTIVSSAAGSDTLRRVEALYFAADDFTFFLDGTNNAVLAGDDSVATGENAVLTIATADLLANDRDFDGDTIRITAVDGTSDKGASVTLIDGQISYTPGTQFDTLAAGEVTTDTFTYTVDDGKGGFDVATITVTITGQNDAPVLTSAAAVTIDENTNIVAAGIAATDVDSTTITYRLAGVDAALFSIDAASGALSFITAPDFETPADTGGDNIYDITILASDDMGGETTADLSVTVVDVSETPAVEARINEVHYDNAGADVGEFVEIRVAAGADVSATTIALYNGSNGTVYATGALSSGVQTSDGTFDYYVLSAADLGTSGIQNGAPDGIALINGGNIIEFLSYEGTMSATDGPAAGLISTDIGVAEDGTTLIGQSLQRDDDGNWNAPAPQTPGAANETDGGGGGEDPLIVSIGTVQGAGFATPLEGISVQITGTVTYSVANGFFMQDAGDGDAATSDGIFVFTGTNFANTPSLGDGVTVTGTATEFFDATQIGAATVTITSSGNPLPTPADIFLGPDSTLADKEAVEGMRIALQSATQDPITIITNFNLDRFGSIVVSAGVQYQPTQRFDAQTEQAAIQALREDNANNRLVIDDGLSTQNPTAFRFVPNTTAGDNGNGFLDAGDTFSDAGPTLRLGAEMAAPVTGVLTYAFGEYTMYVDGTLPINAATNEGARQATPDDVGGTLQVAAFNVLNYFTTFSGGSGPDGLSPRGANNQAEFDRQTDKIVAAMDASGVDIFALQEIENGGFGPGSAIQTLADSLNGASLDTFRVVDPTGGLGDGFIGNDAITTGIIYDDNKVDLITSDVVTFAEPSAAVTLALAEDLAALIGGSNPVGDFQRNRPAVIATFADELSGQDFTVVSVHFKSKGDSGLQSLANAAQTFLNNPAISGAERAAVAAKLAEFLADPNFDQGDGQGFWNGVRTDAAEELHSFLTTEYDGGGVSNYLILGDFNAYSQEDPTQSLADQADTVDLLAQFVGEDAYSFVFDGQRGALDQVIADTELASYVTGLAEWHINADEPDLLGYDTTFTDPAFYSDGPFASSDHDPVILGLDFSPLAIT